jgi:hypothetical protein
LEASRRSIDILSRPVHFKRKTNTISKSLATINNPLDERRTPISPRAVVECSPLCTLPDPVAPEQEVGAQFMSLSAGIKTVD